MSYQVIARKYRPQRFSEVIGQDHVSVTLANAITQNRIAHAYLFCGPRGTGKTTIARIFAKCLNCTGGPKTDFPDDDPRAREIAEGRSLDVIEIDGASNRGIEEIRELRDTVRFAPATSRFKIYIIDEVHMLTKEAFNALLKTLEEPPAHAKFMFATTEPEKVLATILSRCQRFDLRRIPTPLIVNHLASIAVKEGIQADEKALLAVARGADGGMRDAESTLDQLISFCGNTIQESDVLSMFGLTAQDQIQRLTMAILQGENSVILGELDSLAKQGKDLGRLLGDVLDQIRNVLVFQTSGERLDLLDLSEIEAAALRSMNGIVAPEGLCRILDILTATEGRMRDAGSKRIVLEVGLLKAAQASRSVPIDQILRQLQLLRDSLGAAAPASPQPVTTAIAASQRAVSTAPAATIPSPEPRPSASHSRPAPSSPPPAAVPVQSEPIAPPPSPPAVATDSANRANSGPNPAEGDLVALWMSLVEAAGKVSAFTKSYLIEAHPVSFIKNVLTIGFDPEFGDHMGLVDNAKTRGLLQTKLAEAGHRDCQVKFIQSERPEHLTRIVQQEPQKAPSSAPPTNVAQPATSPSSAQRPAPAGPTVNPRDKVVPQVLSPEVFKNDPLIKEALEIFKGTIVEVRG